MSKSLRETIKLAIHSAWTEYQIDHPSTYDNYYADVIYSLKTFVIKERQIETDDK
jgi:hypothetical protein